MNIVLYIVAYVLILIGVAGQASIWETLIVAGVLLAVGVSAHCLIKKVN